MIKIIAQFRNHSGPTGIGEHNIKFVVQKEFAQALYPALNKLEKTPQVIMYLVTVGSKEEGDQLTTETEEQRWARCNKKIHALFDEIGELKNVEGKDVKKTIKDKLIKEGKIKKSLTELNMEGQFDLISRLENILIDGKYNDKPTN